MPLPRWFTGGFVMGAAAASAAWMAWGDRPRASPGAYIEGGRGATDRTLVERAPSREVELRAEIAELRVKLAAARGEPAPETPPAGEPPAAQPTPLDRVREQLREARDAEPGSARVRELVAHWRAGAVGTDAEVAEAASHALVRLAQWGKLPPELVDGLATEFLRLYPGAPGRPGLAAAVACAWARDPRLANWFDGLPPVEEPAIRAAVVEALDESPSDAYRQYLLRVSRTETSAEVLDEAWHEDPITVALTPQWAPQIIAAIEPRIARGDLPAEIRARGLYSIGLAGQHDAAGARAAITRLVARETDEGVRAFGRGVAEAVDRGEANVQVLDALWSRHRRAFGG